MPPISCPAKKLKTTRQNVGHQNSQNLDLSLAGNFKEFVYDKMNFKMPTCSESG